ncbi:MAG TPA: DUF4158 domain-containing protein [Blastocatellia bacterium]|nr:DUF4158 domain-containing protein [Blastocatellia bacterium]
MARMRIFNLLEEQAFESPPIFNSVERKKFFSLPLGLEDLIASLHTPPNQVCFTLQLCYFKARRKSFGKQFRTPDIEFVATRLGFTPAQINLADYDRQTSFRHQQHILEFFGFQKFDHEARVLQADEIASLVSSHVKPKVVLLESISFLVRRRIAIPSYYQLARMVRVAIKRQQQELASIIDEHLTLKQRQMLDDLLEKEKEIDSAGEPSQVQRYRLTLLKKSYQSTQPAKIKANLADLRELQWLYCEMASSIAALKLTHEGLGYYANSVIKAEIFQVARRSTADRYLHLLSFIAHQTFKLQDTLIDTLLQCVQTSVNGRSGNIRTGITRNVCSAIRQSKSWS